MKLATLNTHSTNEINVFGNEKKTLARVIDDFCKPEYFRTSTGTKIYLCTVGLTERLQGGRKKVSQTFVHIFANY